MRLRCLFAAAALAATSAAAQDPPDSAAVQPPDSAAAPSISTLTGVYTAEQADQGSRTYRKNCTSCHAPVGYTGLAFRRVWNGRSVFDFFDLIRTTMPNDEPGKLSRDEYAEIMAYLLKLNGLPAGEKALPSGDEELKMIRIEIPPRTPPQ